MENRLPQTTPDPGGRRARRRWEPDANDHLVFQWVKFEGKTQGWVARQLGISQPTVSRIIDRYERWQAHADPREGGRLDPAERLRAQRWLTYERNELILASALRIAGEMEGVTEMSKSVRTRPLKEFFSAGTEIRSEERTIDRHGVAARFLRLAFRINMEQLKLVESDPPPLPEPLSAEESEEVKQQDAQIAAELEAARRRGDEQVEEIMRSDSAEEAQLAWTKPGPGEPAVAGEPAVLQEQVCSRLRDEGAPQADSMHHVNNLHKANGQKSAVSPALLCSCDETAESEKTADAACIAPGRRRAVERGDAACGGLTPAARPR